VAPWTEPSEPILEARLTEETLAANVLRVRNELESSRWALAPGLDFEEQYEKRMLSPMGRVKPPRIQIMPPSPGSTELTCHAYLFVDPNTNLPKLYQRTTHQLRPEAIALFKTLPKDQITHRGRTATVFSSTLQVQEMRRRVALQQENAEALRSLTLTASTSRSLAEQFAAITLKHMVNDPDKIRRYIKDHEFSSIVPGLKWADLPAPPHELYDVMFEWHKEFHEKLAAGEMHGMIFADPLNMGGRARSKTAIEDLSSYLQDPTLETLEDRARMVFFHVSTASTSMVLNKKAWYREVVGLGTEYFQHMIDHELITPVIDGGQVYGEVSDALLGNREPVICALGDDWNIAKEGELVAYDGNNWESFTPPILGEGFTPWMTPFGGQIHLPSGNYATSALDGLAMQCSNIRVSDLIVEY